MRLLVAAAVAGCVPSADGDPGAAALEAVPSPAGSVSGEPNLSTGSGEPLLSWLEADGGRHHLKLSRWTDGAWTEPVTVASSGAFFVNWADFPSALALPDGRLAAHWLARRGEGTYDYGVRVAVSSDGGSTWSDPWTPHDDETPTEHGFVTLYPAGDGLGVVWLDGRNFAPGPDGTEPTREMTLRHRVLGPHGPGPEELVDARTCDCCQTDVAVTPAGPLVVYRDRSPDEVRDIYVSRRVDGRWLEGEPVHEDGWVIGGCPVNGPSVAARGSDVAVAWFTAAGDVPRVRLAFSPDAGAHFGSPVQIDDGDPVGRVDVLLLDDGSALVAWLERVAGGAEVRLRRVTPGSGPGPSHRVAASSAERSSGFPRMTPDGGGGVLFAWTETLDDATRVRTARLPEVPR